MFNFDDPITIQAMGRIFGEMADRLFTNPAVAEAYKSVVGSLDNFFAKLVSIAILAGHRDRLPVWVLQRAGTTDRVAEVMGKAQALRDQNPELARVIAEAGAAGLEAVFALERNEIEKETGGKKKRRKSKASSPELDDLAASDLDEALKVLKGLKVGR